MNCLIEPGLLQGTVSIPASKSAAHRALICAGLSKGKSVLKNVSDSEDITATIGALKTFAPVYLLTKGGPGTSTTVPSYYSYNQFFQVQQVGYGAAISTALTVVIIVFSIVFTLVQKHVEKELV